MRIAIHHPETKRHAEERRGVVLLAVLVVVVLLSLAAYQYSGLMTAEFKANDNYHQQAQAKAFAKSGVHLAAGLLANPDTVKEMLNGNPFHNAEIFHKAIVSGDEKKGSKGYFSLIAPIDPDDFDGGGLVRHGVTDEGGKININAFIKRDAKGKQLYDALLKLPNMTDEIAAAIVDWVDADGDTRTGGAESDYYAGLTPPYRAKNGGLESIEELLLVKGVTPELLFGTDLNRNGVQDPGEGGEGEFTRGWSAFLTIYSRDQNPDAAFRFINKAELEELYDHVSSFVSDDMAKFVVLYRQYGPSTASGQKQSMARTLTAVLGGGIFKLSVSSGKKGGSSTQQSIPGNLADFTPDFEKKANTKIKSLFDLVGKQVTVPGKDKNPSVIYSSPLNDPSLVKDLMPKLFAETTAFEEEDIPPRINVNTAPREVLATISDLTETDIESIISRRPKFSSVDGPAEIFDTPTWLLTEALIKPETLSKLEKSITTRSQVYKVQVLGYFEGGKGPMARVEAVIDTNNGRPRIVSYRDLTDLGRSPHLIK